MSQANERMARCGIEPDQTHSGALRCQTSCPQTGTLRPELQPELLPVVPAVPAVLLVAVVAMVPVPVAAVPVAAVAHAHEGWRLFIA